MVIALLAVIYLLLLRRVATFPDLEIDDPHSPVVKLPSVRPTINAGLHFLLPVIILIWCLMVERLSPGLSAFWGALFLIVILLTQRPLLAYFRKQTTFRREFKLGWNDLVEGLEAGARNMIGIGIATATAGIIVGVVSLTGFGVQLATIIETLSMGNIFLMLLLVAGFSLILGMGLPTTANYIVVSSLMAVVIIEVGRQNGFIVPLIAVHLFVFYFGIMADVTPPVGLASFAASAVSGGDPIKTGLTAFSYSLRTAILPFLFIFNTDLLLIDVSFSKGILVFITATIGILAFTAGAVGYFFRRNKLWESLALFVLAFALFRPGFFMEHISPTQRYFEPAQLTQEVQQASVGDNLTIKVSGLNPYGKQIEFYAQLPIAEGQSGEERLQKMGLTLFEQEKPEGKQLLIDAVEIDSIAAKVGLNWDQVVLEGSVPVKDALAKEWLFIPTLLLLFMLAIYQRRRQPA
ncbi:TRAP dicarboxylate transporter subunit DctM [Pasteurella multocida 2000]|nr:TRAP dicarboxylate transporter subunit DctM [Pasteurella multocida 1500E]EPE65319.1 TRAP dicarboxylate transporter subunit DctM [Pasteurella multocida 2000]EPE67459.1 TRAP dicarboxylate transporter subunit DctM [Pasteurella multocida P1933]